ncbi:hypothetical protein ACC691_39155, partial [Rhizobium johnstonii]|uniref:hypothetical protein n=1 Tax=Rhizobium johnstonii TaxID=3019933 RepID=UPI003F980D5B
MSADPTKTPAPVRWEKPSQSQEKFGPACSLVDARMIATAANLNEETRDGHKSAGSAGIIGVVIVFLLFEIFTIATLV